MKEIVAIISPKFYLSDCMEKSRKHQVMLFWRSEGTLILAPAKPGKESGY